MKRVIAMILGVMLIGTTLAGCGQKVISSGTTETIVVEKTEPATEAKAEEKEMTSEEKSMILDGSITKLSEVPAANPSAIKAGDQTAAPQSGDVVAIIHTSMGDISMRFFPEAAPMAVNNFIALAKAGKYDNTIFHRVINQFMIQGGDFTNFNGTGGESIYGEEFDLEIAENVKNIAGSVAMANRGPGTNGSQFYINQIDNPHLDNGGYTVFGQVYDGMDVVNSIAGVQTDYSDKPVKDVTVKNIEITTFA